MSEILFESPTHEPERLPVGNDLQQAIREFGTIGPAYIAFVYGQNPCSDEARSKFVEIAGNQMQSVLQTDRRKAQRAFNDALRILSQRVILHQENSTN